MGLVYKKPLTFRINSQLFLESIPRPKKLLIEMNCICGRSARL